MNTQYQVMITDNNSELIAVGTITTDLTEAERFANDYNYKANKTYAKVEVI